MKTSKRPPRPQAIPGGQLFIFEHEAADLPLFTRTPGRATFSPFAPKPIYKSSATQNKLFEENF